METLTTYYLYNSSSTNEVYIYKSKNTASQIVSKMGTKSRATATSLSNGFYGGVHNGFVKADSVYADNMGDKTSQASNWNKYSDYINKSGTVYTNLTSTHPKGSLIVVKEVKIKANTGSIFARSQASKASKETGYLAKGASVTVINVIEYNASDGTIKNESKYTASNTDGNWYKVFKVNGNSSGVVQGNWINMTDYADSMTDMGTTKAEKTSSTADSSINKDDDSTASSLDDVTSVVEEENTIASYSSYISAEKYLEGLEEGLEIKDIRNIMGLPYQFLPLTDPRIDANDSLGPGDTPTVGEISHIGTMFAQKIINPIPLLLITPGSPEFMTSYNKKQKELMLSKYLSIGGDATDLDDLISSKNAKFYSLRYNYTEYFHYVNAMCRSAAYYLEIQDETIDGKKLGSLNWMWEADGEDNEDIFGHEGLYKYLGTYAGALPFYIEAETSISDSFSNDTSTPSVADTVNSVSEKAKEANFLLGTANGAAGGLLDDFVNSDGDLSNNMETAASGINKLLGSNNILSTLTNYAATIASGGRMVFPEIWSNSSFSRSYSVKLKFPSPSGDKLSIYLNSLVPVFHCFALTWPRQSEGGSQAYYSPFLIRAYYKGIFNVDMGIITDMSFSRGSDGEWTDDGLPTTVEVSLDIKDLYSNMFMSKQTLKKDTTILSNISELDYIGNMCGININEPDVRRTVEMFITLGFTSTIKDKIQLDIFGKMVQWANQKVQNIFGRF